MSAIPAEWTGVSDAPRVGADAERVQRRTELRHERQMERRTRRRWAVLSCAVLACSFGCTVGILDLIR